MTTPTDTKALRELVRIASAIEDPPSAAQLRAINALADAAPALLDEIEKLREEVQTWVDRGAYYRNLAVEAGVKREMFDNENDARLVDLWEANQAERDSLKAEVERLRAALTPSGETKAAYMGEFKFTIDGEYERLNVQVPWTTIKDIMAAIRKRAALRGEEIQ